MDRKRDWMIRRLKILLDRLEIRKHSDVEKIEMIWLVNELKKQ